MSALAPIVSVGAVGVLIAATYALLYSWGPGAVRTYLVCMGWGVLTGAATGTVIGTIGGAFGGAVYAFAGGIYGLLIGAVVAFVPTALGGLLVTGLLCLRHPEPSSEEELRRDLTASFASVVGVLDAAVLVAVLIEAEGVDSILTALAVIGAANLCVTPMLVLARRSIGRTWSARRVMAAAGGPGRR
ncbi:MAG: hypothetical protein ACRD12_09095 [Acidimicrobiales bacterium]